MNLHRWKDLRRKHLTPKQIAKVDLAVKQDAANMEAQSTSTDRIPMNNKKIKSCLARIQKLIRETIRQAGGIHPRIEWDKKKRIWVGSAPPTGIADCCGKTKGEVSGKLTDALVSYVTTMIPPKLLNKGATHEVLRQSILSNLKDWEEERGASPKARFNQMVKRGLINKSGSLCRKPRRQITIGELQLEDVAAWASHNLKAAPMFNPTIRNRLKENLFPWMGHLPANQQNRFLAELTYAICRTSLRHFGKVEKVLQLLVDELEGIIYSWKSTALIYADPKLSQELKRPLSGKTLRIPRP